MNTIKNSGLKVKAGVKAGSISGVNHSRVGLKVRASVKAGALQGLNHNRAALKAQRA